jgi:hypothetical protein
MKHVALLALAAIGHAAPITGQVSAAFGNDTGAKITVLIQGGPQTISRFLTAGALPLPCFAVDAACQYTSVGVGGSAGIDFIGVSANMDDPCTMQWQTTGVLGLGSFGTGTCSGPATVTYSGALDRQAFSYQIRALVFVGTQSDSRPGTISSSIGLSFTEIPEPGSIFLCSLAGAFLASRRFSGNRTAFSDMISARFPGDLSKRAKIHHGGAKKRGAPHQPDNWRRN